MTSIFGVVSKAGRAVYSASKFGLVGLSRALALEVAADNVLVNCLAPGFVDTDMTRGILGRQGIAEMAVMTGQQMVVDGGFTCE